MEDFQSKNPRGLSCGWWRLAVLPRRPFPSATSFDFIHDQGHQVVVCSRAGAANERMA